MKRAIVIAGVALIVTTALTGCGPSESEAAPVRPENAAPARTVVSDPVVSAAPTGETKPARVLEVITSSSDHRQVPLDEQAARETRAALAALAAAEEEASTREVGIVPRDAHIDLGAETLERRTLLEGNLSLLVPRSFTEMGPVMLQAKYPSQNRPSLVLTNESGAVNIAVNYTSNRVKQKDLPSAFNVIRAQLRNAYPTARWYASELTTVNGLACFSLDFRTPAVDTQVRNIMVGTVLDGRLLLISFNTTRELEDTWAPIGEAIVDSIQLD